MTSVAPSSHQAAQKQRQHDNKLTKRIMREAGTAIVDYNMIEDGDKVMVCLSGGKDSYSMLDILLALQKRAPIHFDIIAVNLDQKQPGFPAHVLPDYLTELGVPFHIENQDTYSIVKRLIPEGKTTCSLCSRLRRGILYRVAAELGATKIALGHHRDDILATFFLNLFYAAKLKSMPPKLVSDDGRHTVIRPLAYIAEKDLIAYSELKQFPIIPCNLCGSQENLKRQEVGRMIAAWEKESPKKVWNTFKALSAITPSHLMDRNLFDFAGLRPTGVADENGDKAFDADTFADAADTTVDTGFAQADDDHDNRHRQPSTHSANTQAAGKLTSGNPARARTIRIQSL
ncbi:tRNA s(2)C-32 sulfurtransferase [Advenella incenata]|uniref:tRNA-cytidine(32) 2-sulfurtransferase n=1 Tax=Advenella incenata TaxID=267800 RepID=A0A4Q7VCA4_9BURK|nr:tRNA 2-thiocytidine(32) synthetase TtcA [Advenella incenata]RZT94335.1 tRNA s(2)C-32 sulfurtransferase [Advenella incenata]